MTFPDLFLILAEAGAPDRSSGGLFGNPLIMIAMMFALMYFLVIRPQSQQRKRMEAMIAAVSTGDKLVSGGGIHGTITSVKDTSVIVKIADNVKIELEKTAIARVLPKGGSETESA